MRALFLTLTLSASLGLSALEPVDIAAMGKYQLSFVAATEVQEMTMPPQLAEVSYLPKSAMKIVAPFSPQQILFLVSDGSKVKKGQRIAQLSGSEVHHFMERYEAQQALMQQAENRYFESKKLFERQAINQEKWQQILTHYYDIKISFGHLQHFAEMFQSGEHDDEGFLVAQQTGIFIYPTAETQTEEMELGSIIEIKELRLLTKLPANYRQSIVQLKTSQCAIKVESVEPKSLGFNVNVWSESLTDNCALTLGDLIEVTPVLSISALEVPSDSIFSIQGITWIAKKQGQQLMPVRVDVIGKSGTSKLLIKQNATLNNAEILSQSVSALQGILLGLGAE
ncbi:hypothetical protein [Glaciecola sp. 1036]|uniref:hypothetical protein n=1 Tax=Alteromonadaceae TaxID=72275 RepID=UPI003D024D59